MNLDKIKTGNYIRICSNNRYYILKINGFTLDLIIKGDSKIQVTATYPKSLIYVNTSLSYETLETLQVKDVSWNRPEKLMKLLYG